MHFRFVWGEEDAFAEPESGQTLADQMDNARLVRVPDARHLPWLDHPDETFAPILEFLGESDPADPDTAPDAGETP